MKNLLRKLLQIQTWQLMLVNPNKVSVIDVSKAVVSMPIKILLSNDVEDIKVIDRHIVAIRKGNNENENK